MKKVIALLVAFILAFSTSVSVFAAESNVVYSGKSGEFVFAPGSEHSPTDLFTEFKDVMPGDTLTQKITVENKASDDVKVNIYLRSLGADENSKDFLSQLTLKVQKSEEDATSDLFDAKADETAGLTDWVCLGTLYSGGKVNLDVTLGVPVELDNAFQNAIGNLNWEFKIEEFPIEEDDDINGSGGTGTDDDLDGKDETDDEDDKDDSDNIDDENGLNSDNENDADEETSDDKDDHKTPQTGDTSNPTLWFIVLISCSIVMVFILVLKRRKTEK